MAYQGLTLWCTSRLLPWCAVLKAKKKQIARQDTARSLFAVFFSSRLLVATPLHQRVSCRLSMEVKEGRFAKDPHLDEGAYYCAILTQCAN